MLVLCVPPCVLTALLWTRSPGSSKVRPRAGSPFLVALVDLMHWLEDKSKDPQRSTAPHVPVDLTELRAALAAEGTLAGAEQGACLVRSAVAGPVHVDQFGQQLCAYARL